MTKLHWPVVNGFLFVVLIASASCVRSDNTMIAEKVSSRLITQVDLRTEQLARPTVERLDTMRKMGMNVDNLRVQRIFIHLTSQLTPAQVEDLEAIGITIFRDSWIPPVGAHPTGYILADMPVDKLAELTRKDYVVRVDTAELELEPQNQFAPQ